MPRLRADGTSGIGKIVTDRTNLLEVPPRHAVHDPLDKIEQALDKRLASRQATCPVSVSFGPELLDVPIPVSRAVTHGHCLLPASGEAYSGRSSMIHAAQAVILSRPSTGQTKSDAALVRPIPACRSRS